MIQILTNAGGVLPRKDLHDLMGVAVSKLASTITALRIEGRLMSYRPSGRFSTIYLTWKANELGITQPPPKAEPVPSAVIELNGNTGLSHNLYTLHPEGPARPEKEEDIVPERMPRKIASLFYY
jgi:hypothetical protein